MQHFEQMQRTKRKHTAVEQSSTFPEEYEPKAYDGNGDSDIEDMLEKIDAVLRALGHSAGIEAA